MQSCKENEEWTRLGLLIEGQFRIAGYTLPMNGYFESCAFPPSRQKKGAKTGTVLLLLVQEGSF